MPEAYRRVYKEREEASKTAKRKKYGDCGRIVDSFRDQGLGQEQWVHFTMKEAKMGMERCLEQQNIGKLYKENNHDFLRMNRQILEFSFLLIFYIYLRF